MGDKQKMRIILPYHLGSGNRGCEGIARGIATLFQLNADELVMYDISEYDFKSDLRNGLSEIGELRYGGGRIFEFLRLCCRVIRKFAFPLPYYHLLSSFYLKDVDADDIVFITGGDIYCYENEYKFPNLIVKKAKNKGIKTVLFGVSMEEKFLDSKAVSGLKRYDLIITREAISSATLTKIGLKNFLYPDPAFSLVLEECSLPDYFTNDNVVGINMSPFTDKDGLFIDNMNNLLDYFAIRGMVVCLIPHVFWNGQDDRISINQYKKYFDKNVYVLDSENLSYLQIRYVISKCKYFIGGRTHSVISAYSTHTPCIALGYSVKAKGIAKEVGMPEYTVVDSKNFSGANNLLDAFKKLELERDKIMAIYEHMDEYIKTTFDITDKVMTTVGGINRK